jgi:hypothetical protein
VLETYYALQVVKGVVATADYQFIGNPAYNAQRRLGARLQRPAGDAVLMRTKGVQATELAHVDRVASADEGADRLVSQAEDMMGEAADPGRDRFSQCDTRRPAAASKIQGRPR